MLAKLDNLGPFQFFFTLSCADKRWDENLSSILQSLDIAVEFTHDNKGQEETVVKYGDNLEKRKEISKFIEEDLPPSKHELLRSNVVTATRNYSHRVRAFIRDIVRDRNNPMCVENYTTKVEFQGRGAAHNHGVLWLDMKKMEYFFIDDKGNWSDFGNYFNPLDKQEKILMNAIKSIVKKFYSNDIILDSSDQTVLNHFYYQYVQTNNDRVDTDVDELKFQEDLMARFPLFGISSAFKNFQTNEDLKPHEEKAVINFVNRFTTCTKNVDTIRMMTDDQTLKETAESIIRIVEEVHGHHHTTSCIKYSPTCRWGFPHFPMWRTILAKPMKESGEETEKIKSSYQKILKDVKEKMVDSEVIESIMKQFPIDRDISREAYVENRMERIKMLLTIAGYGKEEHLILYESALTYSKKGYSVILERDVNEMYINSYNPEWARAWNGNTDLQPCFDYFAVITYITEYFCKDDTGLMVKLTDMVKKSECATLKERMVILMNGFISARQMGEAEALYKLLPNLHLKDSNVTTIFVPTNWKENRVSFL